MVESEGKLPRYKHCPCCGCELDAAPGRRANFRRWWKACVVLMGVGAASYLVSLLDFLLFSDGLPQGLLLFAVAIQMSVLTLFFINGAEHRKEGGPQPPSPPYG